MHQLASHAAISIRGGWAHVPVMLVSGFGGLGASVQKVVRACRCVALVGMAAVFDFALA